jgi:hypothetical protein
MHRMPRPLLVIALMLSPVLTKADTALRFDPAAQTVPTGSNASLSVMLDDALDVRTIILTVRFDPAILTSLSGTPGDLYDDAPCSVFHDFHLNGPGEWYSASITIGFDCWVTGPGELYRWNFNGTHPGTSQIEVLEVVLLDPASDNIPDVTLPSTVVYVGEGTATPPPPAPGLELNLAPNPFNPSCRITFSASAPGPARLEVFDLAGRHLATPWQGALGADPTSFSWQAAGDDGRPLASGVYLFRLTDAAGRVLTRRGTLLK